MAEESKDKIPPEKKPVTGFLIKKWNKWNKWVKISLLGMAGLLITIWAVAVILKP